MVSSFTFTIKHSPMDEVHASLYTYVYDSLEYNFLIQIIPLSVFQKSSNYCLLIEIFEN